MVRFGILGAGHFAAAHVKALGTMPDRARVAGYARRDSGTPFREGEAAGACAFSPDALIASEEIDAVCVCVPNHLHRTYAEAALRAGKHVFCEKPLALSSEDADAMLRTAEESGRILMAGHLARHIPAYAAVKDLLAGGSLGTPRIVYASRMHCGGGRSWRMDAAQGGGVIFDLLIHDIDLLRWYIGRPRSVVARGHRHEQGGYDYIGGILSYENGVMAVVEGGFVFRPPAGLRATMRIVCERGHIEINTHDTHAPVRIFEEGRPERLIGVKLDNLHLDGLAAEFTEFLDTIDGMPPRRLHLRDARDAVAVADAIVRAADTAAEVFLA